MTNNLLEKCGSPSLEPCLQFNARVKVLHLESKFSKLIYKNKIASVCVSNALGPQ